ncbi:MAG TPA: hypothetical protein VHF90_01625 [Thermoleophilaceae bacterium]|nr:hypothetical protein [Thermoleophilaceae bacterium]
MAVELGYADAEATPELRGALQRRIVRLPDLATTRGMTSRQVADRTSGDEPNCHTALKGLAKKEIVETVEGSSPQRFRLTVKHRRNRVLLLSRLLRRGEWTTYGDFSIAVYDSSKMGLPVARLAARHPAFANPHRVLGASGRVSPEWQDETRTKGPEECKRRLSEEGAWDAGRDRARDSGFVAWETLRKRLDDADEDPAEPTT